MKKVLIFGVGGMIGHQMYLTLSSQFNVFSTIKRSFAEYEKFELFDRNKIFDNLDVSQFDQVLQLLDQLNPDVILNCIGITLRKKEISDVNYTKKINADFPHFLESWVQENNKYLIHFSTDCVFSGKSGPYTEDSTPDAHDIYGQTKGLGEVSGENCLTLRGSMIGFELYGKTELLEWVFSQKHQTIKGFTKAIYSGITTLQMSKLVANIIESSKPLIGLYQVSSAPISKYDLVSKINEVFDLKIQLQKDENYSTEKILLSEKIIKDFGFHCPDWSVMLEDLHAKYSLFPK